MADAWSGSDFAGPAAYKMYALIMFYLSLQYHIFRREPYLQGAVKNGGNIQEIGVRLL